MAMTKKERAEFDAAILRAETIAALRWTEAAPPDIPPPDSGHTSGWLMNPHAMIVEPGWSEICAHGRGDAKRDRRHSGSQGGISLYSTKLRALQDMRHQLESHYAEQLQKVDKKIEAEKAKLTQLFASPSSPPA